MQADRLAAGRAVGGAAQLEDERRDHQVDGASPRERPQLVERAQQLRVARQVEAGLLEGLADRRRQRARVVSLAAAAGEAHVAGPGVAFVLCAADEQQLRPAAGPLAQHERDRRPRPLARETLRLAAGERAGDRVPVQGESSHEPARTPGRDSRAWAWVSQR